MSKLYSTDETLTELRKEIQKDISQLYNADCIKWSGKTKEGEYYSEVTARELLSELKSLESIQKITRTNSYKRNNHSKIIIDLGKSNRLEDIFAKRIYGLDFNELGRIIDFQVPMRNSNNDKGIKAFDVLSFKKEDNSLYLIELKYLGNKETLLRAILECYTYYKIVDHDRLRDDFSDEIGNSEVEIKPVILLVNSDDNPCNPYIEYDEMECGERSMLKALSLALGIKFVICDLPQIFDSY